MGARLNTASSTKIMKAVLAITLALVAVVSAQTEPWCRCAFFISSPHLEIMVYELPELAIDSCDTDGNLQCETRCRTEIDTMTNGLDLWYQLEDGDGDGTHTVGSFMCDATYPPFLFIHNSVVQATTRPAAVPGRSPAWTPTICCAAP